MPEETYEFGDSSYEGLSRNGISPLAVLQVLHGGAAERRYAATSAPSSRSPEPTGAAAG